MLIRSLERRDFDAWIGLRRLLWPDQDRAELADEGHRSLEADPALVVFVAEEAETVAGFIELGLRPYAEGCASSPVPYIEGWFVAEDHRGRGIGKALMAAAESWSRDHGFTELASDTQLENTLSQAVHQALGFEQAEALVVFRKDL